MASRGPGEGPRFEYAWSCLVGDMEEMNETGTWDFYTFLIFGG